MGRKSVERLDVLYCFPADQVDIHLLRCQQLRLYILKAGRALLCYQDKLRQILSQPAVADIGPSPTGETRCILQDLKYIFRQHYFVLFSECFDDYLFFAGIWLSAVQDCTPFESNCCSTGNHV